MIVFLHACDKLRKSTGLDRDPLKAVPCRPLQAPSGWTLIQGLATKIYIAVEAIDMRKGFEGLHGLVRDYLGQDPLSRHLFLFTNKTKTRLKALVWDGSGLWVCAKRLEKGWVTGTNERNQ
jgi:hypothetical protein